MSHHCHAAGCEAHVPPRMLMCRRHWSMVPRAKQSRIWATYRAGQCDDWMISHAYAEAARDAVRTVAEKEGVRGEPLRAALMVYDMLDPGPAPGTPTGPLPAPGLFDELDAVAGEPSDRERKLKALAAGCEFDGTEPRPI
jgi:hypothetical protein